VYLPRGGRGRTNLSLSISSSFNISNLLPLRITPWPAPRDRPVYPPSPARSCQLYRCVSPLSLFNVVVYPVAPRGGGRVRTQSLFLSLINPPCSLAYKREATPTSHLMPASPSPLLAFPRRGVSHLARPARAAPGAAPGDRKKTRAAAQGRTAKGVRGRRETMFGEPEERVVYPGYTTRNCGRMSSRLARNLPPDLRTRSSRAWRSKLIQTRLPATPRLLREKARGSGEPIV
jgi:hypothetical protein